LSYNQFMDEKKKKKKKQQQQQQLQKLGTWQSG
jgi:hypothetical protein